MSGPNSSGPGPISRSPRVVPALPGSGPAADFIYDTATDASYIANNAGSYQILDTGSGDITGSSGATDNAIIRADGVGGKTIQSSSALIDDNGNIIGVNLAPGLVSIATAAGTTTLTVASKGTQVFTGTTTQTVALPVVSTLPQIGFQFFIINDSSGAVTVNSSGGNAVQVMAASTRAIFTCVLLTGTSAASWATAYVVTGIGGSTGATDNAILRADGTGGATLQGSGASIGDTGILTLPAGSQAAPSLVIGTDADTGFFSPGADQIAMTSSNTYMFRFSCCFPAFVSPDNGVISFANGVPSQPSDVGIDRNAAGVLSVNNGTAIVNGGALRDIKVRDAFLDGEKSLAALATDADGKIVMAASDERLKDIHEEFRAGLPELEFITPRIFEWKDGRAKGLQAGLIAQDVQRFIPLAVSAVDDEMGTLQIHQSALIAALINSVQELSSRVKELENR